MLFFGVEFQGYAGSKPLDRVKVPWICLAHEELVPACHARLPLCAAVPPPSTRLLFVKLNRCFTLVLVLDPEHDYTLFSFSFDEMLVLFCPAGVCFLLFFLVHLGWPYRHQQRPRVTAVANDKVTAAPRNGA